MVFHVVVSTIVALLTGYVWYQYLFPKAAGETMGSDDAVKAMQGRNMFVMAIAMAILSGAVGTFLLNRGILNDADLMKNAIKTWFGFFFPVILVSWAYTRGTLTTLIAHAGFWLIIALEFAVLTRWLLF